MMSLASTARLFALLLPGIQACGHHYDPTSPALSEDSILAQISARSAPAKTAIHDVRVFDGHRFTAPQTVVLDGGRIIAVVDAPSTDDDDGAETTVVVDGRDRFLIPGLFDAHLHIGDLSGLETATSYGLTTVLNMACRDYAACAPLRNQTGLASFLSAGIPATGANSSHAKMLQLPDSMLTRPGSDMAALVAQAFGNGSDFYKITAETNGPTLQQQRDAVVAAHENFGGLTMTHASDMAAYIQAVASRTDGLQHIPDDGLLSPCTIAALKEHGQFSTPTMTIFRLAYSDPAIGAFLGRSPNDTSRNYANVVENVKRLHAAGVPILAGTDAIGSNVPGIDFPHGRTLHGELSSLVNEAGLSPLEALRAATVEPAKWHRLTDRGSIEVGKRADLVLLNSNPLVNISNTLDIARVWAGGVAVAKVATLT